MAKANRTITEADKVAAQRLRSIWTQKKRELGLTQEKAADILDMTQGGVSHYLTGRTALGPVATLRFSRLLAVSPKEIRPDFEFHIVPGDMPQDVVEAAVKLASLPVDVRKDVANLIDTLSKTGYAKLLENIHAHAKDISHGKTIN